MSINDIEVQNTSPYVKLTVGNNPLRIVSAFEVRPKTYKDGKKEIKYSCLCIDRKDQEVRLADFSKSIFLQIKDLANTPEYAFADVPNYDITINRIGSGQFDTKYKVIPARQNTPLTPEEQTKLLEVGTLKDFIAKLENRTAPDENFEKMFG